MKCAFKDCPVPDQDFTREDLLDHIQDVHISHFPDEQRIRVTPKDESVKGAREILEAFRMGYHYQQGGTTMGKRRPLTMNTDEALAALESAILGIIGEDEVITDMDYKTGNVDRKNAENELKYDQRNRLQEWIDGK